MTHKHQEAIERLLQKVDQFTLYAETAKRLSESMYYETKAKSFEEAAEWLWKDTNE